jgi:hypothetical protein
MNTTTGMVFEAMASDGTGTVTPMRNSAAFLSQQANTSKYFSGSGQAQTFSKKQKTGDKVAAAPPVPKFA